MHMIQLDQLVEEAAAAVEDLDVTDFAYGEFADDGDHDDFGSAR